jgi:hypothetical protein
MSVLDFLWQGQPPPSITTYGTSTQNIPQFMSDYVQGLLNRSNAVASEPWQSYGAPRIADFNADQNNAFQQTRNMVGSWSNPINSAQNTTGQIAASANPLGAAQPYLGAAAGMNPSAAAGSYFGAATGQNGAAAASPYLGAAAGMNPMGAAQPYMGAASQTWPGAVSQYMNPYTDQVVNRIGEVAGRNLRENLLPAMGDDFIKAGQYGSSRMQEMQGRALRDTQEGALAAQSQALQQGYGQSAQIFGQDASRLAGLAGTAGQLGLGQQSNMANIGSQMGNLTNQYGSLLGNIGSSAGSIGNAQMGNMANMGQVAGNLSNMGANTQLQAAGQQGTLANLGQTMGLRDAAAMENIGLTQQGQTQKNMDLAYQDFLQQRDWPKTQLEFMNAMVRGMPYSSTGSTTNTAPTNNYQPSGLAQLAGYASLFGGMKLAKGGRVKKRLRPRHYKRVA